MQPANDFAVDAGLEQSRVGIGDRLRRDVAAQALNRQVGGGGIERPGLLEAGLRKKTPNSALSVTANDDASASDAALVVLTTPTAPSG